MTKRADHKFDVTVHSDDLALLHAIRGLTFYAEAGSGFDQSIAVVDTTKAKWDENGHA